jgi:two-component system nitrate/nitrite sensor histidine kinase NarX
MMFKTIRSRLSILFFVFLTLVSVSVGATYWGLETQRQDALVINLAGRQRMLIQQMTRLAAQWNESRADDALAALREAESTFDLTLTALRVGGEAPYLPGQTVSLPPTRDPEVLKKLNMLELRWNAFHAALDETISAPADDALAFVQLESTELVGQADEVVRAYQFAAEVKMARLRAIQIGFLVSALLLIVVGGWVTNRSVIRPLYALEAAAQRIGQNDFETQAQVEGPSEMRMLGESFERMRASLSSSRRELVELTDSLERRVAQRTRELDALNEVSREIASQLDVRHVLNSVTDKARMLLNGDSAMLCLLDDANQNLLLKAVSGVPSIEIKSDRMSTVNRASAVLTSRQALVCSNTECVGGCGLLSNTHSASHVVAPLRIGDHVIGALCVSSSQPNRFSKESAEVVTKLANTAAVALQNAQLYAQAERVAMLEERQRLAAEMHDGLGQTLSYLGLMTDQAAELVAAEQVEAALEGLRKMRETIEKTTNEVRRAINRLMDETPFEEDLCARLRDLTDEFASTHNLKAAWQSDVESAPDCSREVTEQVLNITREALTNAHRHAHASQVVVCFGRESGQYQVSVEDDGVGFDPLTAGKEAGGHFGLRIMQARAAHIGGQIKIVSRPGEGTRLELRWLAEESL